MLPDHPDAGQVLRHLVGGDRADVADVLGHHEVGVEPEDGVGVDLVQGASLACGDSDRILDAQAALVRQVQR